MDNLLKSKAIVIENFPYYHSHSTFVFDSTEYIKPNITRSDKS